MRVRITSHYSLLVSIIFPTSWIISNETKQLNLLKKICFILWYHFRGFPKSLQINDLSNFYSTLTNSKRIRSEYVLSYNYCPRITLISRKSSSVALMKIRPEGPFVFVSDGIGVCANPRSFLVAVHVETQDRRLDRCPCTINTALIIPGSDDNTCVGCCHWHLLEQSVLERYSHFERLTIYNPGLSVTCSIPAGQWRINVNLWGRGH